MCLCVGCWLEGGKLFKVHFRNVNAEARG